MQYIVIYLFKKLTVAQMCTYTPVARTVW